MGGKPWTSKGCIDCRRRKIKCDERRPECGRCLLSGIKCQGWDAHRNFVGGASIHQARKRKTHTSEPQPAAPARTDRLLTPVHPAQALRAQVFASFMHGYFSSGKLPPASYGFDDSLLGSIARLPGKSMMTDRALSAMSCLFVGKIQRDPTVFNHGLYLYHTAIQQMANTVHRGTYTPDILYTALIFQEIDIFHVPYSLSSWGTQVAGMNTLLRCYRAKTMGNSIIDTIYNTRQKFQVILSSTGMNLSEYEYEYLMEPANGDPLIEILQMAVAIGSVKTTMDALNAAGPAADPTEYEAMQRKCYEIQHDLTRISQHARLNKEVRESETLNKIGSLAVKPLFGRAYDFESPDHAGLCNLLWIQLCVLQPLMRQANALVRLHTGSTREMHAAPQNAKFIDGSIATNCAVLPLEDLEFVHLEKYADKIARSMPYFLRESEKLTFGKFVGYGISMILLNYVDSGNLEKHTWGRGILKHMGEVGMDLATHLYKLTGIQWDRRWGAADPMTCISLRETKNEICNTKPLSSKAAFKEGILNNDGSVYSSDNQEDFDET